MTRYYDCPISAAYMNRYFGVITQDKQGDIIGIGVMQWEARNDAEQERYYIHPDSLPVFEAKMGDLIEDGDNDFQIINYDVELFIIRHGFAKIIQRDGKPFIWPEVEE